MTAYHSPSFVKQSQIENQHKWGDYMSWLRENKNLQEVMMNPDKEPPLVVADKSPYDSYPHFVWEQKLRTRRIIKCHHHRNDHINIWVNSSGQSTLWRVEAHHQHALLLLDQASEIRRNI